LDRLSIADSDDDSSAELGLYSSDRFDERQPGLKLLARGRPFSRDNYDPCSLVPCRVAPPVSRFKIRALSQLIVKPCIGGANDSSGLLSDSDDLCIASLERVKLDSVR
jgi:hypothetical protein